MKKVLLISLILVHAVLARAQDESSTATPHKWFAGGGFGLAIGNYTLLNLSPQLGYRFNKYVAGGGGINLLYVSQKEKLNGLDYSKTTRGITGINLFGRFYPVSKFFAQVQPEGNYIFGNVNYYQAPVGKYKLDAEIVPSVLVGGGVALPSGKGVVNATVLYDALQYNNSPYGRKAIFNIGYNFSL